MKQHLPLNSEDPLSRRELLNLGFNGIKAYLVGTLFGAGYKGSYESGERFIRGVYPVTGSAKEWDVLKQREYFEQCLADWYYFGEKGFGKRKWWEETKEKERITPQKHTLSCEFSCLEVLLRIKRIRSTGGDFLSEDDLISLTPINTNPLLGRPANIDGAWGQIPPQDYGIYAKALAGSVVRSFNRANTKLCAWDIKDFQKEGEEYSQKDQKYLNKFLELGRNGNPFIFWFQCNQNAGPSTRFGKEDLSTIVAPTEHAGICITSTKEQILYIDPLNMGVYRMGIEGENGLLARAANVGYNLLDIEKISI